MKIPEKCDKIGCDMPAIRWFVDGADNPSLARAKIRGRCSAHAASLIYHFGGKWAGGLEEKTKDELLVMEIHDA
jgi:hypothetical protein